MEATIRFICFSMISIINISCGFAQNLVPNPSFEDYTECPFEIQNGSLECAPWQNGNCATCDYYHTCAVGTDVWVPTNWVGIQQPHTGDAYMGLICKWGDGGWQEYPQVQLTEPLVGGYNYNISFYVSLPDYYCGIPHMGAYFSTTPPDGSYCGEMSVIPQVEYQLGFISDTQNWTLVSGCFVAQGGEQWLTIGNFYSPANTPTDPNCFLTPDSYYYIDDVSVTQGAPAENIDLELGDPVTTCEPYEIESGITGVEYYWSDGSNDETLLVTTSGTYTLTVTMGCVAGGVDSVEIFFEGVEEGVDLGPSEVSICEGENYIISLDPDIGDYEWQDGSTDPEYTITTTGTYQVSFDDGCDVTTDEITVFVIELIVPEISGVPSSLCENDNPVLLNSTQDGITGVWTGPGVSNNHFDPSGFNGYVTLTFTPIAGQCAEVTTIDIDVEIPITPSITGIPNSLCQFNTPIPLPENQSGIQGNWSGQGVTNNTFNPAGLNGDIFLTFTPDAGFCAFPATASITVFQNTYSITGVPQFVCETDPPFELPVIQNGIIGNWSGQGVFANIFDPEGQSDEVSITFTPEDDQCALPASQTIIIEEVIIPIISGIPSSICEDNAAIVLPEWQNGIIGQWSGPGISNNTFNPNNLNGPIVIDFTPEDNQCADNAIFEIIVSPVIVPEITGVPSEMCGADFPISLNTNQNGINGSWSGPGVMNNVFDPEGLSGIISVEFIPDNPCALIAIADIVVLPVIIPFAAGLPDAMCQTDYPLPLPDMLQQIPGNWSGAGVSNNMFNPDGQNGNIILTFTPELGQCAIPITTTIVVSATTIPIITGVPTMLCQTDSALLLPEVISGITGKWSGQNVDANVFMPDGLDGSVTLEFTPYEGQCAQAATAVITIHTTPAFINLIADCESTLQTYTVSFDIIGGDTSGYMVDGVQVGGTHYTSPPILSGNTAYHFTLNDVNGCGQVQIEGNLDCSCATFAGTMIFPGEPVKICEGSDFSVAFNGNAQLDPDDVLRFVLHDQAGTQLGTIYAMSDSAAFAYPSGIVLGQTYYVSPIAGSNNGFGGIDMLDPCLSVSQGIPVIFYRPEVMVSGGGNICPTECITYDIKFSGEKPFEFKYRINLDGTFIDSIITSDQDQVELTICPSNYNLADGVIDIIPLSVSDANCMIALSPLAGIQTIVYPEYSSSFSINLCPGQSFVFNETIYDQLHPSGIELLQAVNGCDSLVEVNVYYYAPSINEINQSLCFGGSLEVNGTEYNESHPAGTEVIPGGSVNGCDSIIIVDLSFNSFVSSSLDSTLCSGEVIQINGNTYDESNPTGSEVFPGQSVLGCDSIVNIQLSFFPPAELEIVQTLCKGEWIVVNGTIYDEIHSSGVEVIPNASVLGCDSTIMINLSFNPEAHESVIDTLAAEESIVINGTVYNQSNAVGVEVIPGGSVMGCDSIITIALHFHQALSMIVKTVAPICHGESTGQIIVEAIAGGKPPYLISINGGSQLIIDFFPVVIPGMSAGTYNLIIEDGSFNTIEINVEVPQAPELNIDAGADLQVKEGNDVQLNVNASFIVSDWSWSPVDFLSCTDCPDPIIEQPDRDIIYTVTATNGKGCEAIDVVKLTILPKDELYIPTIFSPNGDGVNDTWRIYSGDEEARLVSLSILDRWGGLLFNCADRLLDDPGVEWDGSMKGSELGAGVYVFVAEVNSDGKNTRLIKGDITLIR